ncbi:MAG: hypothetical protein ACKVP3_01605 [Hyphomicrobiaceae bacterium]
MTGIHHRDLRLIWLTGFCAAVAMGLAGPIQAERLSDIRNTKHNLSVTGPGPARAVSEDEICVFCHTPHNANVEAAAPLWNRSQLPGTTYTPYTSSSMDALGLGEPGGSSKVCLSCHDGTIALGAVNVLNGASTDQNPATEDIAMSGTAPGGTVPEGEGPTTGFTRRLGTNLTNDHPVSFNYNDTLALRDGELRAPSTSPHIANRVPGVRPEIPLENDQLQCTSCHDPHIRDTVEANIKFLRLNRFQQTEPFEGGFDKSKDTVCLGCHDKQGWVGSAHANSFVANEIYKPQAATLREFSAGLAVWQAACLNCHDAHTVEGARRLLREGTDAIGTPKRGGRSAIEQTCYQCHSSLGDVLVGQGGSNFEVPDVGIDFLSLRHMPIADQPEVHDIGTGPLPQPGKDLIESQQVLGKGSDVNRHVECTDCHNPHRAIKKRQFNDSPIIPDAGGTHRHEAGSMPNNIASGVLKGSWGVEPVYGSSQFLAGAIGFDIKRGDPPVGASTSTASSWVTREYQICLKCHSTYAYDIPPDLGFISGGTPSGTNGVAQYTDQAMEFQAPLADRGEAGGNHRSWHPVMESTGRSAGLRRADRTNWLAPWNNDAFIGSQTMYCSDCHGSETAIGTIVPAGGEDGRSWGPHGSINNFILKGAWDQSTGGPGTQDHICFKCHAYDHYAVREPARDFPSGFGGSKDQNLHAFHADKIGRLRCTWCHVAVPHGWKNKGFLVNLNDVGPEAGVPAGTQVRNNTTAGYTNGPYYLNAMLKVRTFATSGNWEDTNCGSAGAPGNGEAGKNWMKDSSENCNSPP